MGFFMSGLVRNFVGATGIALSLSGNVAAESPDNENTYVADREAVQMEIQQLSSKLSDRFVLTNEDNKLQRKLDTTQPVCMDGDTAVGKNKYGAETEVDLSGVIDKQEGQLERWFGKTRFADDLDMGKARDAMKWMVDQDNIQFSGQVRPNLVPEDRQDYSVVVYPVDQQTGMQTVYIANMRDAMTDPDFVVQMADALKQNSDKILAVGVDADNGLKEVDAISRPTVIGACSP